jgi:peptidyl-prolyl cis-trans isomerase D
VAADFNMQLIKVDGYTGGEIPELGASPDFFQAVSGLKKGEVSQSVAANNKVAVAEVTDVIPAHPSTFEEVQNQIRDTIAQNRSVAAVQRHAQELIEKTNSSGGDFAKAAKSMGLEVKTTPEFERNGTVEGVGSASYFAAAFDKPVGSMFGPAGTPDGSTLVGKVVSKVAPDPAGLATARSAIRDDIKSQRARDRATLFENGIKEALIKDKKIKIHQDVIDRLIASYSSKS